MTTLKKRHYRPADSSNPVHYRDDNRGECIDAMPDHFRQWIRQNTQMRSAIVIAGAVKWMMLGFCLGNAFKYRWRAGAKEGEPADKDLQKAGWYDAYGMHVFHPGTYPDPRPKG